MEVVQAKGILQFPEGSLDPLMHPVELLDLLWRKASADKPLHHHHIPEDFQVAFPYLPPGTFG